MTLSERVLADPINDLEVNVDGLEQSTDEVWHIDRHVIEIDDVASVIEACLAAIALARKWSTQATNLRSPTRWISKPYVLLDDSWLRGEPSAPAPHVYICIASSEAAFDPATYDDLVDSPSTGVAELDAHLRPGRLFRVASEDEESTGSWIFDPV